VLAFSADGAAIWTCEMLERASLSIAQRLLRGGIKRSQRIALWAPNSPQWIIVALAIMVAGGVLVPIDDMSQGSEVESALDSSGARLIYTTARHLADYKDLFSGKGVAASLVDEPADSPVAWDQLRNELPSPMPDDAAVLSWTSGTTGAPKAFLLTYRNISSNVEALRELDILGQSDNVLLPLPLHHAYPFIVGMLTALSIGAPIILPADATGPAIMHATREGDVTAIVGVPRLYQALLGAINARIAGRGRALRSAWWLLMHLAALVQRKTGVRLGRVWFAPVRRRVGRRLRYLISGGAKLPLEATEHLETLGWIVLSGYGLAETASIFTGNSPNDRHLASEGRALTDGKIRIRRPDEKGVGEIELHGRSITRGYLNNPEANRNAFTSDGWFRTGDLGFVDKNGFLHVTGRSKELLVLGGGKKVSPEELEQFYGTAPQIREIAVLEQQGVLTALVRPDHERVREMGTMNLREGIRIVLAEKAQNLSSYQRLSGFVLTDEPLPRTRLGKFRRFLLPRLYQEALAGRPRRQARAPGPDDQALLKNPIANAIWLVLRERYPEQVVDLDVNLSLDLNLDSFGWMELALTLQDQYGVRLTEADIASINTIRDLLVRCRERQRASPVREPAVATQAIQMTTVGPLASFLGMFLYAINRCVVRGLFSLHVEGTTNIPDAGAFVIVSNHASYLDALVIAAALPLSRLRQIHWSGSVQLLFGTKLRRLFSHAVRIFPVDERRPDAAIAAAVQVLDAGHALVWFPESWRSPDGALQRFLPGIGQILLRTDAAAIPAFISGTFKAWPRGRRFPKIAPIAITFGCAENVGSLRMAGAGPTEQERITCALRERVVALSGAQETP
jgi:long-chain acyl-CoA synthetase